jgi:hypothetical protein
MKRFTAANVKVYTPYENVYMTPMAPKREIAFAPWEEKE